jgi:hypothetical protein
MKPIKIFQSAGKKKVRNGDREREMKGKDRGRVNKMRSKWTWIHFFVV